MATTPSPPISECNVTIPECLDTTSPMIAAFRPSGWARMTSTSRSASAGGNDGDQLSFIGHVKRVEPQHLARRPRTSARTGMPASVSVTPTRDAAANSFKVLETPPRVGVAHGTDAGAGFQHGADQAIRAGPCRFPARSRTRSPRGPT